MVYLFLTTLAAFVPVWAHLWETTKKVSGNEGRLLQIDSFDVSETRKAFLSCKMRILICYPAKNTPLSLVLTDFLPFRDEIPTDYTFSKYF